MAYRVSRDASRRQLAKELDLRAVAAEELDAGDAGQRVNLRQKRRLVDDSLRSEQQTSVRSRVGTAKDSVGGYRTVLLIDDFVMTMAVATAPPPPVSGARSGVSSSDGPPESSTVFFTNTSSPAKWSSLTRYPVTIRFFPA
eukprot:COSAG04_NODE_147_length_22902_cov_55.666184_3_plen_141_part_00